MLFFNVGCVKPDYKSESNIQNIESVEIPQTNAEIRFWYNRQVVIIPTLNKEWIREGVSPKKRARQAYSIRHNARIHARLLMKNKEEVDMLRKRDLKKYGNPDGPTLVYLIEKQRQSGLSDDEAYEEIVKSSSRTSAEYNQRFGIKR